MYYHVLTILPFIRLGFTPFMYNSYSHLIPIGNTTMATLGKQDSQEHSRSSWKPRQLLHEVVSRYGSHSEIVAGFSGKKYCNRANDKNVRYTREQVVGTSRSSIVLLSYIITTTYEVVSRYGSHSEIVAAFPVRRTYLTDATERIIWRRAAFINESHSSSHSFNKRSGLTLRVTPRDSSGVPGKKYTSIFIDAHPSVIPCAISSSHKTRRTSNVTTTRPINTKWSYTTDHTQR